MEQTVYCDWWAQEAYWRCSHEWLICESPIHHPTFSVLLGCMCVPPMTRKTDKTNISRIIFFVTKLKVHAHINADKLRSKPSIAKKIKWSVSPGNYSECAIDIVLWRSNWNLAFQTATTAAWVGAFHGHTRKQKLCRNQEWIAGAALTSSLESCSGPPLSPASISQTHWSSKKTLLTWNWGFSSSTRMLQLTNNARFRAKNVALQQPWSKTIPNSWRPNSMDLPIPPISFIPICPWIHLLQWRRQTRLLINEYVLPLNATHKIRIWELSPN